VKDRPKKVIERARQAAIKVLKNNFPEPEEGFPRTAAWGYPEPYTRDLLISSLGILASGDEDLIGSIRPILETLAENQSSHGQIPGLVDVPEDLGSSDTTPLFLLVLEIFRKYIRKSEFLEANAIQAATWLDYQSPIDEILVGQLPTSDWRDEQWVFGYGLYVNCLVYLYLKLKGKREKASVLKGLINDRLSIEGKPFYTLYAYKNLYKNERFDLLGNSLAIISGVAERKRAVEIVHWVEEKTAELVKSDQLSGNLPPVLFPYIEPGDEDWQPRYRKFNLPGDYHNGGIWPFTVSLYLVSLIKIGLEEKAEALLTVLTRLIEVPKDQSLEYGFNEWYKAQTLEPMGQDWQTWSAATYIYAVECLKRGRVVFLER